MADDRRLAYVSDAPVNWEPGVWARSSSNEEVTATTDAATAATSPCSSATCGNG